MDINQIVSLVAYRMGNVRGQDTAIQNEVYQAINRLEVREFLPWFLLSEMNFYTTKIGEPRVPIPRGFLMEYEEGSLFLDIPETEYTTICKKSLDQIADEWTMKSGKPLYYALTNSYFRLYPIPDAGYKIEMIFYRKSEFLKHEDGENAWFDNASDLVVAETCWGMLTARRDKQAEYWRGIAEQEWQRLIMRDTERREMNRDVTFGGY